MGSRIANRRIILRFSDTRWIIWNRWCFGGNTPFAYVYFFISRGNYIRCIFVLHLKSSGNKLYDCFVKLHHFVPVPADAQVCLIQCSIHKQESVSRIEHMQAFRLVYKSNKCAYDINIFVFINSYIFYTVQLFGYCKLSTEPGTILLI